MKSQKNDGSPLTVLHIAPTPFFADRGCHIRIRNEALALAAYPVRLLVCTYHLGDDPEGMDVRRILRIPGYHKLDAGFSPFRLPADFFLLLLVVKTCLRERPDVLHAHLHEGVLIGWLTRCLLFWQKMPLLMDMQGSLTGELSSYGTIKKKGLLYRLLHKLEALLYRLPEYIICSSREGRNTLITHFRLPSLRSALLPDIVPEAVFAAGDPSFRRQCREKMAIPPGKRVVLYTGSLLPGKGVEHLRVMIKELAGEKDILFILAGYPVEELEQWRRKQGLEDRVMLPGRFAYDELPHWLALADVAVEPKQSDSGEASGKLLHYMAAGLPVACFATRNNTSFLRENGYFAQEISGQALAEATLQALDDPEAVERGRCGRTYIRDEYSLAAVGDYLARLYDCLCGRK